MVKKIVLKNGLRIVLAQQKSSQAATALVLVEAGSEYETKKINGLSHFLEHLAFKGTSKRPQPGMIATELDTLGSEYNAFTGQEYTGYWAKAQKEKLPRILDIVSDMYLNPIFNPQEIEKERGVVIEELNMFEDTPMRRVHDFFMELLYGDQPAGWDVGGRKEVIRTLKREDFLAYRGKHYVPQATTVVVSGNFDEEKTIEILKNIFGGLKKRPKSSKFKTKEFQKKPAIFAKFKESDQTHLVLGARAFDIFDERRYGLQVLADVLGGGMSSRLFRRVREEMGAAYYVRAGAELFLDHGYLSVSAGIDHGKVAPAIKAILEEMKRLASETVGAEELKKVKDHLIGNLFLGLETSDELAGFYGGQEVLTRRLLKPEEIADKIQNVGAPAVKTIARSLFADSKLNLAVIGPHRNTDALKKILRFG